MTGPHPPGHTRRQGVVMPFQTASGTPNTQNVWSRETYKYQSFEDHQISAKFHLLAKTSMMSGYWRLHLIFYKRSKTFSYCLYKKALCLYNSSIILLIEAYISFHVFSYLSHPSPLSRKSSFSALFSSS